MEFTRLADVEKLNEVPESATVLAEVGGEIKRVPKTEVGGGKNEYDAVFEVKVYTDDEGVTLVSGDYTTVRDKIMVQKEEPKVKVISVVNNYGIWHGVNSTNITVLFQEEDESIHIIMDGINGYGADGTYKILLFSDNTLEGVYS